MKHAFAIPVILAFIFTQVITAQGLKIGVCIDPQISWLTPESKDVDNEGVKMGINGGLIVDNYFQKNYALSFGLLIGTQGGSLRYSDPVSFETPDSTVHLPLGSVIDYKLNYITVPLSLKLKTNQIGYFSYFAQVGFTNQFRLKAKASSGNNLLDKDIITKEVGVYNFSYHFGAGIEYEISNETAVTLAILFHNGFIDVTKNSPKVFSRAISFRVGVIF